MKLYILFIGSTYTTNQHGGREESLEKDLVRNLSWHSFNSLCYWATPTQHKLERKKKRKKVEFVFPFVGKHKNDFAGHPRNSVTMTADRHWSILWSTVVTAWQVTSSFSESWQQNTQQNRAIQSEEEELYKKKEMVSATISVNIIQC